MIPKPRVTPEQRARLPFLDACAQKWTQGEDFHRGADGEFGEWKGAHPLLEGNDELIDFHNYLTRGRRMVPGNWPSERKLKLLMKALEKVVDLMPMILREAGLVK